MILSKKANEAEESEDTNESQVVMNSSDEISDVGEFSDNENEIYNTTAKNKFSKLNTKRKVKYKGKPS